MRFLKGFGQFWYDFVIGDDWKIAVAVVLALAVGLVLLLAGAATGAVAVVTGVLLLVAFTAALLIDIRSS